MIKMSNTSRKGHAIFTLCDMTYFLVVLLAVICGVIKGLCTVSYHATTRNASNARKSACVWTGSYIAWHDKKA